MLSCDYEEKMVIYLASMLFRIISSCFPFFFFSSSFSAPDLSHVKEMSFGYFFKSSGTAGLYDPKWFN